MLGYYTIVTVVGVLLIVTMIALLFSDEILKTEEKQSFLRALYCTLIASIVEWIVVYLEQINSLHYRIATFSMSTTYFLGLMVPLTLIWKTEDIKSEIYHKTTRVLLGVSIIISFSALFSDKIFYYESTSNYHRGDWFFIVYIQILLVTILLFIRMYEMGKKYYTKSNIILVMILSIFMIGVYKNFASINISMIWITIVTVLGLLYIYYSSLLKQMDVLTGLLNRRSFDNQVYDIRKQAIILILDVNKFKYINDTYGHGFGDVCLMEIGKVISKIYAPYGDCYRIGGDEFCVILTKEHEKVEELKVKFNKALSECKCEYPLPTVSTGYSLYLPNKSSVQKVLEDADEMMYREKSKEKLED